jgi:beta-galactosidase
MPLVYITERRFTERHQKQIAIKVYSNCKQLTVTLNGKVLNMVNKGLCIFICSNAQLQPGKNTVHAVGIKGNKIVKDDMSLNYVSAN